MSKAIMRVPVERVEKAILLVRGEKVMLDRDLAALYEIPTKALKQAVRRNIVRFPEDFMFVLDKTEFEAWRSQFVTSKSDRKGLRYPPMAFTELAQPLFTIRARKTSNRPIRSRVTKCES
ncbi:MAG: ORF6N domain-containing protein [Pyrinomonadaceae bacterium]